MKHTLTEATIYNLNLMADEFEEKAERYRAVAKDLMNGSGHEAPKRHRRHHYDDESETVKHPLKGRKYNGTHWTQLAKNKGKMMKRIKQMHHAKRQK